MIFEKKFNNFNYFEKFANNGIKYAVANERQKSGSLVLISKLNIQDNNEWYRKELIIGNSIYQARYNKIDKSGFVSINGVCL